MLQFNSDKTNIEKRILLIIVFLFILLRLINLGSKSLWLDEAWSLEFAKQPILDILLNTWERTPPLYYLLSSFWIKIFGDSELSLRFPSFLFSVLSACVFYLLGKEIFNKKVATLGLLFYSLSSYQIWFAQMNRTYSMFVLASLLSFLFFVKLLKNQNKKLSFYFVLSTCFMCYSHHYCIFNLLVQILVLFFLYINDRPKFYSKKWFISYVAIFVIYLPWFIVMLEQAFKLKKNGFWIAKPTFYTIYFLYNKLLFWNLYSFSCILLAFVVLLISYNCYKNFVKNKTLYLLLILWATIPLIIPALISLFTTPILEEKYILCASIPVFYLLSKAILNIKNSYLSAVVTIVVLAIMSFSYYQYSNWELRNWKNITQKINSQIENKDYVVVADPLPYKYILNYYLSQEVIDLRSYFKKSSEITNKKIFLIYHGFSNVNNAKEKKQNGLRMLRKLQKYSPNFQLLDSLNYRDGVYAYVFNFSTSYTSSQN